jgi:hypothetical protein
MCCREILVCGRAGADRIAALILPRLGADLTVRGAQMKDELLVTLGAGRQPECILEHQIPTADLLEQLAKILEAASDEEAVTALASKFHVAFSPAVTAYELLRKLVRKSPETKFVITSHTRGSGLSPKERALYGKRAEVEKVMGFTNSVGNTNYLLRLFSRVYLGKTWKPKAGM